MPRRLAAGLLALAASLALLGGTAARAASLRYCDRGLDPGAVQKDRLLRFAAIVRRVLDESGTPLALVSRSGLALGALDIRYSHAGFARREAADAPWRVRQLYFACDEGRSRLFDQGLAGFVLGTDDADEGYVALLLLPPGRAEPLARAVADRRLALALLAPHYSANAYAYDTRYQNCNQWVAELLAAGWGGLSAPVADDGDDPAAPGTAGLRSAAQAWLGAQGYEPAEVRLPFAPLVWLAPLSPWLNNDDHPAADLAAGRWRLSLPAALEAFVHRLAPGSERVELCHRGERVVLHRGFTPLGAGCTPGEGDVVMALP